jgi:fluoride ion exporter CrcB/FEX
LVVDKQVASNITKTKTLATLFANLAGCADLNMAEHIQARKAINEQT